MQNGLVAVVGGEQWVFQPWLYEPAREFEVFSFSERRPLFFYHQHGLSKSGFNDHFFDIVGFFFLVWRHPLCVEFKKIQDEQAV